MTTGPLNSAAQSDAPLVGGVYNVTLPTPEDKQGCALQVDANGNLKVNVVIGGSSSPNINITQVGGVATGVGNPLFVELSDGTQALGTISNPLFVTGGGGGTQYTDQTNETAGAFIGTAALGYNGTKVVALRMDASNNLLVNLNTALPAGTNVIGHVIIDSGSISATQGTSPWVVSGAISFTAPQHVIVDSGAVTVSGTVAVSSVGGTVSVTQGTSPWVVSLASTTITGTVAVTQSTSPWVISGSISFAAPQHVIVDSGIIAATQSGIWTVGISTGQKIEVYDGTNTATVKAASTAALASDTALVVTEPGSTTTGACANTAVTSTSSAVLAANTARRELIIVNTDIVAVYLGLGQTPTASAYHVVLKPCSTAHDGSGGSFVSDLFKGAVNAIVASTGGHVSVTELT